MKTKEIIKVCEILDTKFEESKSKEDINTMELIVDIKKELFKLVELPF